MFMCDGQECGETSDRNVLLRENWGGTRIAESGRQRLLSQLSESTDAVRCMCSISGSPLRSHRFHTGLSSCNGVEPS